ncbi:MAG: ATP F0F1 synthase subunit B [Hyphomonas sp.]
MPQIKHFAITALASASFSMTAAAASDSHDGGGFMGGIEYALNDPVTLWAFLAFVTFLAIAWKMGALKAILGGLDERAEGIQKELDEARTLREQAAQALAAAERHQQDANDKADEMVKQAKEDAKRIMEAARKDLDDRIARREAMAESRIARAEAEAAEEVRRAAANAATRAARQILADAPADDQFESAAKEIESALN